VLEVEPTDQRGRTPAPLQKHSPGGAVCQAGVVRQRRLGQLRYAITAVWAADLQHLHGMLP